MPTYGSDFACVTDIDANMSTASGTTALREALARRLTCPRRQLYGDPTYGLDTRALISTEEDMGTIGRQVEIELLKDERVRNVRADVQLIETSEQASESGLDIGTLRISAEIAPEENEPFELTIAVSELEVKLLTG